MMQRFAGAGSLADDNFGDGKIIRQAGRHNFPPIQGPFRFSGISPPLFFGVLKFFKLPLSFVAGDLWYPLHGICFIAGAG